MNKTFLLLFLLAEYSLGTPMNTLGFIDYESPDFASVQRNLELLKEMMRNGNESAGIPKMDPYLQYSTTDHEIKFVFGSIIFN